MFSPPIATERPMLLLIDNYDSFVYNLARYLEELGCETRVLRNDSLSVEEIEALRPEAIVISPGPCTPREAGVSEEVVRRMGPQVPILGVCLGHQAIATALGGRVTRAPEPVHGRTSLISHDGQTLFAGLPNPLQVTRYHSLIVDEATLPEELEVTSRTPEGLIMSLRHRTWPVYGVQFHPESVLTQHGHAMLAAFLRLAGISVVDTSPREVQPSAGQKKQIAQTLPILRVIYW